MTELILAIIITTLIFVVMRLFPRFNIDNFQAITINYLVAALLGVTLIGINFNYTMIVHEPWFIFGIVLGILFVFGFQLFAITTQEIGISITVVVTKISMVIPILISFFSYNEPIGIIRFTGIIIALFSLWFLLSSDKKKKRISKYELILIILLFLMVGIDDSILNHNQKFHISSNNELYLFMTIVFTSSFFTGFVTSAIKQIKSSNRNTISKQNIIGGVVLGLVNFGSLFFMLKGLAAFPTSWFFPIFNIGLTFLSIASGVLLFRERLNRINWIGVGLSIIAVILVSIS